MYFLVQLNRDFGTHKQYFDHKANGTTYISGDGEIAVSNMARDGYMTLTAKDFVTYDGIGLRSLKDDFNNLMVYKDITLEVSLDAGARQGYTLPFPTIAGYIPVFVVYMNASPAAQVGVFDMTIANRLISNAYVMITNKHTAALTTTLQFRAIYMLTGTYHAS